MEIVIKRKDFLVIIIVIVTVIIFQNIAVSAEYSANMKVTVAGMISNGKIFVKGQTERLENYNRIFGKSIVITRRDKGVRWMLNPAQKSYIEVKIDEKEPKTILDEFRNAMTSFRKVGTKKISGYMCDKYIYCNKITSNTSGIVYFSPQLNRALKDDQTDGTKMDSLKEDLIIDNIKLGLQNDTLFRIPQGYRKILPSKPMGKTVSHDSKTTQDKLPSHK